MAPSVSADVLERTQCWCRKRASHADAHHDASYLEVIFHNKYLKYPIHIEHECRHGYCVGIVGEQAIPDTPKAFLRQDFCETDRALVNKICYHHNLVDDDSYSVNDEERTLHTGQLRKNRCKHICRSRFKLPVAAGPFAPDSRRELFTLYDMDPFVIKVNEGRLPPQSNKTMSRK
ncbi:hypothetical protein MMC07_000450 [Pseudocyphellaria aurata]|nr:hypothetical protein [Pseudocyphellaria aurata]